MTIKIVIEKTSTLIITEVIKSTVRSSFLVLKIHLLLNMTNLFWIVHVLYTIILNLETEWKECFYKIFVSETIMVYVCGTLILVENLKVNMLLLDGENKMIWNNWLTSSQRITKLLKFLYGEEVWELLLVFYMHSEIQFF